MQNDISNIISKIKEQISKLRNSCKRSGGVTKGDVEIKEIGRYY
ncbi:MAG: hypothetical protein AB1422_17260 [bacterium]